MSQSVADVESEVGAGKKGRSRKPTKQIQRSLSTRPHERQRRQRHPSAGVALLRPVSPSRERLLVAMVRSRTSDIPRGAGRLLHRRRLGEKPGRHPFWC